MGAVTSAETTTALSAAAATVTAGTTQHPSAAQTPSTALSTLAQTFVHSMTQISAKPDVAEVYELKCALSQARKVPAKRRRRASPRWPWEHSWTRRGVARGAAFAMMLARLFGG